MIDGSKSLIETKQPLLTKWLFCLIGYALLYKEFTSYTIVFAIEIEEVNS